MLDVNLEGSDPAEWVLKRVAGEEEVQTEGLIEWSEHLGYAPSGG